MILDMFSADQSRVAVLSSAVRALARVAAFGIIQILWHLVMCVLEHYQHRGRLHG